MDVEQVSEIKIDGTAGRITCSILPYSICPASKDIYFILGKESGCSTCNCYLEEQEGNYREPVKNDWCDFGGGRVDPESYEETAARECVEESIGTIKFWSDEETYDDIDNLIVRLTSDLKRLKYANKFILCINHGAPVDKFPRKYHVCFVKQVPWQPHIQEIFLKKYKTLKSLCDDNVTCTSELFDKFPPQLFDKTTNKPRIQFLEKNDVAYWNFTYLSNVLCDKNKCYFLRSLFVPLLCIVMYHFGAILPQYRFLVTKKLSPLLTSSTSQSACSLKQKKYVNLYEIDAEDDEDNLEDVEDEDEEEEEEDIEYQHFYDDERNSVNSIRTCESESEGIFHAEID
jgi:hypothetical protein